MTAYPGQKSALNVVMGAMTFGEAGTDGARVTELKDMEAILDVFLSHGHREVDTARMYGSGSCERVLGQIDWKAKGIIMQTKLYPAHIPAYAHIVGPHTPEGLRKYFAMSLTALNTDSIDIFYLHAPDRQVPFEETLKTVNELYKEGKFKRFGISNFMSWEVAEVVAICKANGFIEPTVYQGLYNAIHRAVEPELFPCLRKFGIAFYAFNPLGGGFFTGRYTGVDSETPGGTRFDPKTLFGQAYRHRYWNDTYFTALQFIQAVGDKHGLTLAEIALRWVSHHSLMKREQGDAVIIGASSLAHIEQNLVDLEKGPLPEDAVKALDDAWASVKGVATNYFH
uniref:Aldo-keto reductase n=1 Tax=Mycena chlorophos TaxID=658473 RepID=A0ABQ0LDB7_MYCCL|nr:aldo-keto reductase [Mycena chlorophos]